MFHVCQHSRTCARVRSNSHLSPQLNRLTHSKPSTYIAKHHTLSIPFAQTPLSHVVYVRRVFVLVEHGTRPELVPQFADDFRHGDAVGVETDQPQHHDTVLAQVLRREALHDAPIRVLGHLAYRRQVQLDEVEPLAPEADFIDPYDEADEREGEHHDEPEP